MGAPQVTRSATTPVGTLFQVKSPKKFPDFKGLARGARDSVTKLREFQANFSATEARLRRVESRLCGTEAKSCGVLVRLRVAEAKLRAFEFRVGADNVKICAAEVECRPRSGFKKVARGETSGTEEELYQRIGVALRIFNQLLRSAETIPLAHLQCASIVPVDPEAKPLVSRLRKRRRVGDAPELTRHTDHRIRYHSHAKARCTPPEKTVSGDVSLV